jgi:hypothetical protein
MAVMAIAVMAMAVMKISVMAMAVLAAVFLAVNQTDLFCLNGYWGEPAPETGPLPRRCCLSDQGWLSHQGSLTPPMLYSPLFPRSGFLNETKAA